MHDQPLKACFVGLGNQAWWHWHHAYSATPSVQVVAGYDLSSTAATTFVTGNPELGLTAYPTIDEMIATERPDIISITTPAVAHPENVAAIAAAVEEHRVGPIGLWIEKPTALTVHDHNAMLAIADSIGAVVTFGFDRLYSNHLEWARRILRDGRLGEVTEVDAAFERTDGAPRRGAFLKTELGGGGPGADLMSHLEAIRRFVLGDRLRHVTALASRAVFEDGGTFGDFDFRDADVEDSLRVMGITQDGAAVSYSAAWDIVIPRDIWRFEIRGTRGTLTVRLLPVGDKDERLEATALIRPPGRCGDGAGTPREYVPLVPEQPGLTLGQCRAALLQDLAAGVLAKRAGREPELRVTREIAHDVLAGISGAYASARRGRTWVNV